MAMPTGIEESEKMFVFRYFLFVISSICFYFPVYSNQMYFSEILNAAHTI